jgi:hypothetical protein
MMSAASASKQSASASKQSASASKQSASASASKPEEKRIAVWGPWKSRTNHKDYLSGKHFEIATDKTIADLKIAISEYIRKQYHEPRYELPASTKIMSRATKIKYWVADDTHIRNVPDELEIELPM